jgi:hypothetical protein
MFLSSQATSPPIWIQQVASHWIKGQILKYEILWSVRNFVYMYYSLFWAVSSDVLVPST